MKAAPNEQKQSGTIEVPMDQVVAFVRQLSHDLRNHLNAAELQAAFMNEITADAEMKEEVVRLRAMLSEMGGALQRLSASLTQPRLTPMTYEAANFVEDLQRKVAQQFAEQKGTVDWRVNVGGAAAEIDPQVLQQAMVELFTNAFLHERAEGQITFEATAADGELRLLLREPKKEFAASTEHWGREPFRKLKHGHYGVGLHRVRRIVEAHGGTFEARFDAGASELITEIRLPVVSA
jgi:signal transduction histidine kinase